MGSDRRVANPTPTCVIFSLRGKCARTTIPTSMASGLKKRYDIRPCRGSESSKDHETTWVSSNVAIKCREVAGTECVFREEKETRAAVEPRLNRRRRSTLAVKDAVGESE